MHGSPGDGRDIDDPARAGPLQQGNAGAAGEKHAAQVERDGAVPFPGVELFNGKQFPIAAGAIDQNVQAQAGCVDGRESSVYAGFIGDINR
ncbi:hypothetical protein D3C87_1640410 [compost metagenome]